MIRASCRGGLNHLAAANLKAASVAIRMSAFGVKPENIRCIRTLQVLTQSDISAVEKSRHSHAPTC
jgi:hypothetical protein